MYMCVTLSSSVDLLMGIWLDYITVFVIGTIKNVDMKGASKKYLSGFFSVIHIKHYI